jgi:predicted metal-dependent HD superfamily phosphohydrolase
MAVLGKNSEDYLVYAHQIRQEYIHYPESSYNKGRAAVLKKLQSVGLYKTELFREKFEKQAIQNMEKEIELLEKNC